MKAVVALATFTLALAAVAISADVADQKSTTSDYDLVQRTAIPSSAPADLLAIDRSDAEGNYYVEAHATGQEGHEPVLKFDKVGQLRATFVLPPGLIGGKFFVDAKQSLYRLAVHALVSDRAQEKDDFYRLVLVYRSDGTLKSSIKLEVSARLVPYQIGVFGSGDFLISGHWTAKGLNDPPGFYTGIFTSEGKLIKKIALAEDERLLQPSDYDLGPGHNMAASGGQTVLASDGNLYLMRRTLPAVIYGISKTGEVVNTLSVDSDGTGLYPTALVSSEGRLALVFKNMGDHPPNPEYLKVIDLEGNTLAGYNVNLRTGTLLLSFSQSKFTFLTKQSGAWQVADFVPR